MWQRHDGSENKTFMILCSGRVEKVLVLVQVLKGVGAGELYLSFLLEGRLMLVSAGLKFLLFFSPLYGCFTGKGLETENAVEREYI